MTSNIYDAYLIVKNRWTMDIQTSLICKPLKLFTCFTIPFILFYFIYIFITVRPSGLFLHIFDDDVDGEDDDETQADDLISASHRRMPSRTVLFPHFAKSASSHVRPPIIYQSRCILKRSQQLASRLERRHNKELCRCMIFCRCG